MEQLALQTTEFGMHDITAKVRDIVAASSVNDGLCCIYCPHTTAAITINENADPDVQRDMLLALADTFPDRAEFRHFEGNSAAHVLSSVIGASEVVPISDGKLTLGTWQGIYFCEFDGPRSRRVIVQAIGT